MIKIKNLTATDVGRWVIYRKDSTRGETEEGRIKSWNDIFIFVVFKCNNEWDRFADFTGQGCNQKDLVFRRER